MKKGKWNYTEKIEYTVLLVKLLPVSEPKMHWQNAFVNTERQVVLIKPKSGNQFWIDNGDGSGLLKISNGGGPDSYSAHVSEFEFIRELPESEWQQWNPKLYYSYREQCENWQKLNFPNEYERIKKLREAIIENRKKNFFPS